MRAARPFNACSLYLVGLGSGAPAACGRGGLRGKIWDVVFIGSGAACPVLLCLSMGGTDALPIGAAMSAVVVACAAWMRRSVRRFKARERSMRRCDGLIERVEYLVGTMPCKTEAETLAALHEIRNCYSEAIELEGELGDGGRRIAARIRANLAQIDDLYDIQTGSLRRTEANAADFAAAMRALGRDADGAPSGR